MILPGFTIEFDPKAKPQSISGEAHPLWGSVTITLRRPGQPRHAVAFRSENPTLAEFGQAMMSVLEWAAKQGDKKS